MSVGSSLSVEYYSHVFGKNFGNVSLDDWGEAEDILPNSFGKNYLGLENTLYNFVISFGEKLALTDKLVNDVTDIKITNTGEAHLIQRLLP